MSKVDTTSTMTVRPGGQAAALGELPLADKTWTMQDEEPPPGTLPECRHLAPLAVVNWIAFRHAADRDLSGWADGVRRWMVPELGNGYNNETLAALREMAGGPAIWTPPAGAADTAAPYCPVPKRTHFLRTLARLLVRERGIPAADLAALLADELDAADLQRGKAEQARHDLLDALAAGKVQAIGRDPAGVDGQAPWKFQPIPSLAFEAPELVFWPGGSVTLSGRHGLVMQDVRLRRDQLQRAWPAKPMPCRPTRKAVLPAVLDAKLRAWIATLPEGREKRDAAVAWLKKGTGCSRDVAREAYTRLPETMRYKPGKPGEA